MLRPSIKRWIVSIAAGMIILAVITSVMSMALASSVGHLLDELTNRYIPAYADLARVDIRSLKRALTLRRMILAKMQTPPDEASAAAHLKTFEEKGPEVQREAEAARRLINAIIDDPSTPSDNIALTRIDERIDDAVNGPSPSTGRSKPVSYYVNLKGVILQRSCMVLPGSTRFAMSQSKDGGHSCRHAGVSTRERLNSYLQSAASHMDFGNCDGNCCCTRIRFCDCWLAVESPVRCIDCSRAPERLRRVSSIALRYYGIPSPDPCRWRRSGRREER
jgi:hypothetical protein